MDYATTVGFALALAVTSAACSKKPDESKAQPTSAVLPSAEPAASAAPSASPVGRVPGAPPAASDVHSSTDPGWATLSLADRFAVERNNRPGLKPTADQVFEMITKKLKIDLEEQKQVAGWTVGARYCSKAQTKDDVHVVACEYSDEPSAAKGVVAASATNKYLPPREVLQKGPTTLSVMKAGKSSAADGEYDRIRAAFKAYDTGAP